MPRHTKAEQTKNRRVRKGKKVKPVIRKTKRRVRRV